MKTVLSSLCAAVVVVTTMGATMAPAAAASPLTLRLETNAAQVHNVQQRQHGRGFERRGNDGYYNGHRGHRDRRPGYQQHNGFWFPQSAFFGAFLGSIIAGQQPQYHQPRQPRGQARVVLTQQHLKWCEDRYRSYRASDNTFQPYNGPRQQCYSPYYR